MTARYVVPSCFLREAEEYLSAIEGLTQVLYTNRNNIDVTHRLCRTADILKQSAYAVGFRVIGDIAHAVQGCMAAVRDGRISLTDELLHHLAQGVLHIRTLMRGDPSIPDLVERHVSEFLSLLKELCDGQVSGPPAGSLLNQASDQDSAVGSDLLEPAPVVAMDNAQSSILPDEYFLPQLDPEVLSYFVPEAQEYLEVLERDLLRLDSDSRNGDLILQLFRTSHTLKGSAYTAGFQVIGDLVHHVEDFMGAVQDRRLRILPGHTDAILRAIDVVRVLMQQDSNSIRAVRDQFQASLMELKRMEIGHEPEVSEASGFAVTCVVGTAPHAGQGEEPETGDTRPEGRPRDEREVIRVSRARLEQLMDLVGELVTEGGRLEQRLLDLGELSEQVLACKTRLVDAVQSGAGTHMIAARDVSSIQAAPSDRRSCGFVDDGTLNRGVHGGFNILARRIEKVSADMTESTARLSDCARHAHDDMKQLQHVTRNIRDEIARTRMIPIKTPFTRFRRAIRDVARASNKEVALLTSGEHTLVDTDVVERLVDPLVHLVRNAVYHGIELPADRVAKGKPEAGTIRLHAAHGGNSIMVEIEDDGAGLNLEKIRAKAVTAGLVQPEQVRRMTDAEVLQCIFEPGFSTTETIGGQAGRGIGLDVVKQVVEGMNGHIEVQSCPDVGTKFVLHLPLTVVTAADRRAADGRGG